LLSRLQKYCELVIKKGKIGISKLAREKLIKYRSIVQQTLLEYGKRKPAHEDIEVETILNTERDHYQIFYVGWDKQTRVHHCSIHIDLKGGKVWLQSNATEDNIAEDLVIAGVPKEDIVWGFQPSFMRKYTDYTVEEIRDLKAVSCCASNLTVNFSTILVGRASWPSVYSI